MALEPGNLSDLQGRGQEQWDRQVREWIAELMAASPHWVAPDDARLSAEPTPVDWSGFPQRPETCLGLRKTLPLLDWRTANGDLGRVVGHEEYLEWRVVYGPNGKLQRVEFTTEVQEYWRILAAYHPTKLLRLAARFAGETTASWQEIYGDLNPFATNVTPEQRARAFERNMLPNEGPPRSPYNNGQKAICFLSQSVNSLGAAIGLAKFAGVPYGKNEGGGAVRMSAAEAIASTNTQLAVDCRSSDPTIVDVLIRLAWAGRCMSLLDPVGIYILGVDAAGLVLPDGSPMPAEWFDFQRGAHGPAGAGAVRLHQRLIVEVPPGVGFTLGDVIDTAIDEPLRFGGQLASHIRVGLYARLGPEGSIPVAPVVVHPLAPVPPCGSPQACEGWRQFLSEFEAVPAPADMAQPERPTRRGRM